MGKLIDLTGQKFKRWTVIKRVYPNTNDNKAKWLCKCKCGVERAVSGHNLKLGISNSCGCLNRENLAKVNRLSPGLSNMRGLILKYKITAKNKGFKYTLTEEQFTKLTSSNCYYCGEIPKQIKKQNNTYGNYIYNGIDRVDNNLGYTPENTVSCCKLCNYKKSDMTLQDFQDWIRRVYNKLHSSI
uniref:Putative HNH endonuclease n=1 Tax=viral metagenome TaxID=1070528 RepID=A0A6H2A4R9_9ZZZZ